MPDKLIEDIKQGKIEKRSKKFELYKSLLAKKKEKGLNDLFFFNKYIVEQDPKKRKNLVPHVHKEWTDWHESSDARIKMILVPRGSFKTTCFTIRWTIQLLCQDRDRRILIANATANNARKFLSEIKDELRLNEKLIKLYGEFYDKNLKWNEDEFDIKGRSPGIRESAVTAIGAGGNLVSQHYDFIIGDDLVNDENSATKLQADKIIDWWKKSLSLLELDGEYLLIGCLTEDSDVLMADGTWKKIVDVESGEEVWSVDTDSTKRTPLVKKKVERMIPQGKAKVYEVKTKRHSIKCTGDHPFLTFDDCPCCGTKNGKLAWKKVEELGLGDFVITSKQVSTNYGKRIWDNKFATKDFYWLFGFLMGDGWVTRAGKRTAICACYGEDKRLNKKVRRLMEKYFGDTYKTDFGYYRADTIRGRDIEDWGIDGGAKNKRIPDWIFKSRPNLKRMFLRGLIDADGYKQIKGDAFRIELANKELIEDIHKLSLTCSVRPTSIYHRERTCQPPNSPNPVDSETWSIGLVFKHWQEKENKTVCETPYELLGLRMERITSIEEVGEEEVFDLSIKDTHNFIANGYVVHNTRWSYYELYSHLLDKFSGDIDTYIASVYNDDGSLYFPERYDRKKLKELKKLHGSYFFSAFYLNNPVDEESALIKKSQIRYYGKSEPIKKPQDLKIFSTCDPAVSQKTSADYSSIVIVGVDVNDDWYVLEVRRGKWTVGRLIDELFSVHKRWEPETMTIEVIGQSQGLMSPINRREEKLQTYLPLVEIKSRPQVTKQRRIRSTLQPRFEQGKVFVKRSMVELEDELLTFPRGRHDDIIDSLADIDEISYQPAQRKEQTKGKKTLTKLENKLKYGNRKNVVDPIMGEYF